MRRAVRTDLNHAAICKALRQMGVHVTSLAAVGNGVPDLLLSYRGKWHLAEVKDGLRNWKYTPDQIRFTEQAKAEVWTFESVDDAVAWVNGFNAAHWPRHYGSKV